MTNEIRITDNFMFATVMKGESINVIRIRNSYNFRLCKGQQPCLYAWDAVRRQEGFALEDKVGLQDISFLDKGNMYRHLPESYILFICLFNLFGKGLPVFTFENTCREDRRFSLNEKCRKIFYNVNAWEKERNPERRVLLEYFFGAAPNDELTRAMDEQVSFTRNLRQWRKEHMTLEQEIKLQVSYACDDGFSQGLSQVAYDAKIEAAKLKINLRIQKNSV